MSRGFEIATGNVVGRAHALSGRGSQDAHEVRVDDGRIVAVVADGCGSAEQSEVGAWIGANVVVTAVLRALDEGLSLDHDSTWRDVRAQALEAIRSTARAMGGALEEVVRRYFLFTVVGVAIAGERAVVFSAGDGVVAVNGDVIRLGPFPGNAPPYIGHGLLGATPFGRAHLTVVRSMPVEEVESILLATDGVDAWDDVEHKAVPGAKELVGPFAQLWKDDRYFAHPDALRRKLGRMNRPVTKPVWEERRLEKDAGLLDDDATVVVVRRKKQGG